MNKDMKKVRFRDNSGMVREGEWNDGNIRYGKGMVVSNSANILPPTNPSKIVCTAFNYADHVNETNLNLPDRPYFFFKTPNTIVGHNDVVHIPERVELAHYEAEIGVVIGKQCSKVSSDEAMDCIEGFTCINDVSNRDDQREKVNGNMDWVRGKSFDNSAPIGPVISPPENVPEDARVQLRVNDDLRQEFSRSNLIFSVEKLVSEISELVTLENGDIIATGTSDGVGPLDDGDEVEIEVEGIGTLKHGVERI